MPFDLNNLNPASRFWLNEKEWVEFRVCAGTDLDAIDDQTTANRVEYRYPEKKNGKPDRRMPMQRIEHTEITKPKLRSELIWDFSITGWSLLDGDGNEIPCTKENKVKLMQGSPTFATFAADCIEKIDESDRSRKVEQEKN